MLKSIPTESLNLKAKSSSTNLAEEDEFVKCLLHWFKYEFFKWCDAPECTQCGKATSFKEVAYPTAEEKNFLASTIEMYKCETCSELTRFPRYNHPVKLCETKKGRCGEFANLFGSLLYSCGYQVRFIDNFMDHVWNEYWSVNQKRWIHVDSCENAWDTPLMYEQGWGRKLVYVLAISTNGVFDVTRRYIFDWDVCEKRRNKINTKMFEDVLNLNNNNIRSNLPFESMLSVLENDENEKKELLLLSNKKETLKEQEQTVRESGSDEWKKQRGEA